MIGTGQPVFNGKLFYYGELARPSLVEQKLKLASSLMMVTYYSLASHWVAHL
jgi:hypothetical protein